MNAITSIVATVIFDDGRTCKVMLSAEGIQRWGADRQTLGDSVTATEAMASALADCGAFEPRGDCSHDFEADEEFILVCKLCGLEGPA